MMFDAFHDEEGMTTVGVVLSLLVTLALVFSAGQAYRVGSASSEVQNVADAAALAAQNEVGEFMIVVRVCDAAVLSLSLTSLVATGLGVAALCTPATASASETLLKAGRDVAYARDRFAEKAADGLDRLQRLLPFLAAANAASVASANNGASSSYVALALLVPASGKKIAVDGAAELEDVAEAVGDEADEVRQAADEAERAAERANEAKRRAFEHDCGLDPSYCMYERASALAGMSGSENPLFRSVDAWSFSVALKRAQAYYPRRLAVEAPADGSVEEQARSALRKRFYAFAADEVGRGYVHEGADSFDAWFPRLPKNTEEMRSTALYTEAAYPCTVDEEGRATAHAWAGCPAAAGSGSLVSIAQTEAEPFAECAECGFSAASMGKVAAASSSIDNGFEYHYEAVAKAAGEYEEARAELDPLADEVKRRAGGLFDEVKDALAKVAGKRLSAQPPGRYGVVALVANTASVAASSGFGSSFVRGGRARRAGGGFGRHARRRLVRRGRHRGVVAAGRREGPGRGGRGRAGNGARLLVRLAGRVRAGPRGARRFRLVRVGRAASRGGQRVGRVGGRCPARGRAGRGARSGRTRRAQAGVGEFGACRRARRGGVRRAAALAQGAGDRASARVERRVRLDRGNGGSRGCRRHPGVRRHHRDSRDRAVGRRPVVPGEGRVAAGGEGRCCRPGAKGG